MGKDYRKSGFTVLMLRKLIFLVLLACDQGGL